jgi:hypothetical protein
MAHHVVLPLWKKLLFTAILLSVVAGILEVGLRLAGFGPMSAAEASFDPQPTAFGYFAVCDKKLGFRNRPNGRYKAELLDGSPVSTTDAAGFRNGLGWTPHGDTAVVLFVGDSFTFCSEVPDGQTGPSEVARRLSAARSVRVLNAGVRGYSTLQAKRMIEDCFQRFPQIKVVVYTYYRNDLCENLIPGMQAPAKAPVVAGDSPSGKLREVEVTDPAVPFGASFAETFRPSQLFGLRVRMTNAVRTHSALIHTCMRGLRRLADRRTHSFELPDGHRLEVPASLRWDTAGKLYDWAENNGGREVLQQLLKEMARICRTHSAVLLTTYATRGQQEEIPYETEFADVCQAAGVRYVSLRGQFTGDPNVYAARWLDGHYDDHYGPRGTAAFAEALAPVIERCLGEQAGLQTSLRLPSRASVAP